MPLAFWDNGYAVWRVAEGDPGSALCAESGGRSAAVGQAEQALTVSLESVHIFRQLADVAPEKHRAGLAASLVNASFRFRGKGDIDGAILALEEAADLFRQAGDTTKEASALAMVGNPYTSVPVLRCVSSSGRCGR